MKLNYQAATLIALFILIGILGVILVYIQSPHPPKISNVLGDRDFVNITAYVRPDILNFKVYPEKRIPRIGNWATFVDMTLVSCSNPAHIFTYNAIPTDSTGNGTLAIPTGDLLTDGSYRFYMRGYSHLRRQFNCYTIDQVVEFIDLTLEGKELLAGEVGIVYDNYINALDMSYLIRRFYTTDYKADLNQDTRVNSLDFSNQIYNLFLFGD